MIHYTTHRQTYMIKLTFKNLSAIFVIFIFFNANFLSQSVSLREAVQISIEKNENVKRAREKYESKKKLYYASWGNFLPQVNFEWSFNRIDEDLTIDLSPIRTAMISLSAKNQTDIHYLKNPTLDPSLAPIIYKQYYSAFDSQLPQFKQTLKQQEFKSSYFAGIQPLFLGGKLIAAKNIAKKEEDIAYEEYKMTLNETVYETISAYLAAILVKEIVRVRSEALESALKHKKEAEIAYNQGLISHAELLKASAAVAEVERNLLEEKNKYELIILNFKKNLGLDLRENIEIQDSLFFLEIDINYDDILNSINSNNFYLKIIDSKTSQAKYKRWIDFANFLPQIYAFGKYEIYPEYQSALEPRWIVGIQIKQNLFNGFKDYLALEADQNTINEAKYSREFYKKNLELAARKAYVEFLNAKNKYFKIKPTIELFEENLRANEKRFESGYGKSIDVIDSRLSLEKAKIESLQAIYEYYKAYCYILFLNANCEEFIYRWK